MSGIATRSMHINEQYCPQNHPCPAVNMCPKGAIVQKDFFSVPRIIEDKCTGCGICTRVCPVFEIARIA